VLRILVALVIVNFVYPFLALVSAVDCLRVVVRDVRSLAGFGD
jgi:hypothetical protein